MTYRLVTNKIHYRISVCSLFYSITADICVDHLRNQDDGCGLDALLRTAPCGASLLEQSLWNQPQEHKQDDASKVDTMMHAPLFTTVKNLAH